MVNYDVAIVGGGCIGCSVGKHLLERSDLDICILEKEYHLAQHQSGRNSGVLHPGFNYQPGTPKARFSTEGTRRLKEYCRNRNIPLEEFGVLVVATTSGERERLNALQRQATENGVETRILESREEIQRYEPHASGSAALYCPEAASINAQQYVYELAREIEMGGGDLLLGHEVTSIQKDEMFQITTSKGSITSDYLVNAAGLFADRIAAKLGVGDEYRVIPFRGEYYELVPDKRDLVSSMIYPTPDPELPFLGVHFTRRTDNKVIIGPNAVLALGREAYANTQFDLRELASIAGYGGFWRLLADAKMVNVVWNEANKSYRKSSFVAAAQRLVPALKRSDITKSYAGIRAQLVRSDGELVKQPLVEHHDGALHVLNAVSPGLTSSLPFGEHIADRLRSIA